jgi:ubiquinone/menaquinone biosynthesis C-methylase UbiE
MSHPRPKIHKSHLLLFGFLLAGALALLLWPSHWRSIGSVAASSVAIHAGAAVAFHLGVAGAGVGVLFAVLRHGRRHRREGKDASATLHSPRFYDWFAALYCFGREGRMRERTLDVANVSSGERVLDVACGTGTLALAAKRRVGASGSVHGIDASPEMVERARTKAARSGLPATFEIATAQSLPFPDATFDVVLCTLALHHVPEDARADAIAEMRRVVKPGGRVLVVEFGKRRGAWALFHPVALLHAHKTRQVLDGAVDLMRRAGLEQVVTDSLGFSGLAYALGARDA